MVMQMVMVMMVMVVIVVVVIAASTGTNHIAVAETATGTGAGAGAGAGAAVCVFVAVATTAGGVATVAAGAIVATATVAHVTLTDPHMDVGVKRRGVVVTTDRGCTAGRWRRNGRDGGGGIVVERKISCPRHVFHRCLRALETGMLQGATIVTGRCDTRVWKCGTAPAAVHSCTNAHLRLLQ